MAKMPRMEQSDASAERRYVVTVEGAPTECDERSLMAAWARVPDLALRVRALSVGDEVALFELPKIVVRRAC